MQNYKNIEHLVIDGVSTDGTLEILRSNVKHHFSLYSEPDGGIYDAMNKGISLASGDVIGFLNSDDLYADQSVISRITEVFLDSSVDACYGDLVYVTKDNKSVVRYWKSKPFLSGDFAKGWCPAHPTFYVRRSVFERLGIFDLGYKMAQDVELMMRYLEIGKINVVYIPQVLVRMRIGGVSNRDLKNIMLQNLEVIKALKYHRLNFSLLNFLVNKLIDRLVQFYLAGVRFFHFNN
jgi:glycosyltransferase involved in cell wall biosynthesis